MERRKPAARLPLAALLVILCTSTPGAWAQGILTKTPVASGLTQPVLVTAARDGDRRLFIIEKPGRIRVVENGTLLPTPFLDIRARVRDASSEQGLLGLAFHPDYANNGRFFLNYTAEPDGRTVISQFTVSAGDPNRADSGTERIILEIPQFQPNHNGGMIAFGPFDGYLYIGMGDGGSANDPGNRAQDPDSLLGKMLRIDVNVAGTYAIPPDNPFASSDTARPEIWALGLRNPWRWSFDRATGDLIIADVGQATREEIDWESGLGPGGVNYGWRLKEGTACFIPSTNCDPLQLLTDPVTQYLHTAGRCSITGGYVYRGCALPDIFGAYFYGDYCTGEIWSIRYDGMSVTDSTNRTPQIGLGSFDLVSFGEDARGELYVVGMSSGTVWCIDGNVPADSCTPCLVLRTGDVDLSHTISSADIIYTVNFIFKAGPPPRPMVEAADVNCSRTTTSADIVYLVNHVFKSGPTPCDVCTLF